MNVSAAAPSPELPPILVVEDNPMDLDLTLQAFSRRACPNPIQIARDGEEALSYLGRWDAGEPQPAVILLDINMPRVNGIEVLQQLKQHPQYRRIPVVMLTSSRESRDLQATYDLGANSYIEKPVSFSRFMEIAGQIEAYWCSANERAY